MKCLLVSIVFFETSRCSSLEHQIIDSPNNFPPINLQIVVNSQQEHRNYRKYRDDFNFKRFDIRLSSFKNQKLCLFFRSESFNNNDAPLNQKNSSHSGFYPLSTNYFKNIFFLLKWKESEKNERNEGDHISPRVYFWYVLVDAVQCSACY